MKFDLILYSTPPITLVAAIEYVKKRDGARTYLLLKDIFPQNAVDIGMMRTDGIKSFIYKHFRNQEKKLYKISDYIGCMSQANVNYVIKHNPDVDSQKVEVCPNSIDIIDKSVDSSTRIAIREKYGIPIDKKIFVYGGNLGKPQGVPFILECLNECKDITDAFFLIVGDGTEYHLISEYIDRVNPQNIKLMKRLPKSDFDTMVGACDVGLIFLDHRFTIPNFPSRLLAYMQAKLPILACTDINTDLGQVITEGAFGWWCESKNSIDFKTLVITILNYADIEQYRINAFKYLLSHYNSKLTYSIIINSIN